MSDIPNEDERDVDILHEDDVRAVIQDEIEETVGITNDSISDATTAHALNSTFSDTEVESALDSLGTTVNEILEVLRTNGLIEQPIEV